MSDLSWQEQGFSLRHYVYIPLGGSRGGTWMKIRNTFAIFLVSGFWHGSNWTFIIWGFLNACYFLPLMLLKRNRKNLDTVAEGKLFPSIKETIQIGITFAITTVAWIFFRAENVGHALLFLNAIFSFSLFTFPQFLPKQLIVLIFFLVLTEWIQRDKQHALQIEQSNIPRFLKWGIYYAVIFFTLIFGGSQQEFIYFQF